MRSDIVVGVNGSPGSEAALAWALQEACRRRVRVRAILAWADHGRPVDVDLRAASPRLADLAVAAREVLRELVAAGRADADAGNPSNRSRFWVPVDEHAVYSTASHALLQESLDAGLLVIGAQRQVKSRNPVPGPVGEACAHEAPIPLVIVPTGRATTPTRHRAALPVVVGVDGSEAAAAAAAWAAGEAALRHVPLRVVHVAGEADRATRPVHALTIPLVRRYPTLPYANVGVPAPRANTCTRAHPAVADGGTRLSLDGIDQLVAELRAAPGAPLVELVSAGGGTATVRLLDAARDAQLLVLGARGLGGFSDLPLGGTARQCLARASCPTALVRGGPG
jgi:nucleotide-binding universal stress UspA family protein